MTIQQKLRALATMLVLAPAITGCGILSPSQISAPTGDELYDSASESYFAYASKMHELLMAIHEGEWLVEEGSYGADPKSCQLDKDDYGYFFDYARTVKLPALDPDEQVEAAASALTDLGLDPEVGTGNDGDRFVGAELEPTGWASVQILPATSEIKVTAHTECTPGTASELSKLVFPGVEARDAWRLLPSSEGPESQPQFSFPAGSPKHYRADGTPY